MVPGATEERSHTRTIGKRGEEEIFGKPELKVSGACVAKELEITKTRTPAYRKYDEFQGVEG